MNTLDIKESLEQDIKTLPNDILEEVYDFVNYLKSKKLSIEEKEFIQISQKSFNDIWENDEDSAYDKFVQ